jgi:hypothetical protein
MRFTPNLKVRLPGFLSQHAQHRRVLGALKAGASTERRKRRFKTDLL